MFTAPANARLNGNTKYWVRTLYIPNTWPVTNRPRFNTTNSNGEEPAYLGWSIGNDRRYIPGFTSGQPFPPPPLGSWQTSSTSLKISVNTGPAPVYVSNTGQADGSVLADLGSADYAQTFSTGGGAVDFYFGSIELDFERAPGSGTVAVTLRGEDASSNPKSTVQYTLTNPPDIGTGIQRFEALYGVYLADNKNYFVHVAYSGGGTPPRLRTATSDGEEPDAYSGWSIGDSRHASDNGGWSTSADALKMGVNGLNVIPAPLAAPENLTATPGDGQVTVTWDDPDNITIRKYQYSTNGGANFNHMNGSGRNTTSFTFSNLTNGTEYTLAIRAANLSGQGPSATVTATPSS